MQISALIPTYNCGKYIAAAIDSILNQTYKVSEIVIVNNGSTDNTDEILKPYLEKYDFFRCVHKVHEGIPESRNMLVKEAKYDVISFLDADDLWKDNKLELQVKKMEETGCEMVLCQLENFFDDDVKEPTAAQKLVFANPMKEPLNGALIKKTVFDKVGLFDPKHNTCTEDVDWLIRAKAASTNTEMLQDILYRRRVHNANSTLLLNGDSAHALHMIAASLRRTRGPKA